MKKLVFNLLLLLAGIPALGQTLGGLKPGILLSSKGFHAFATQPLEAHRYWHPWSSTRWATGPGQAEYYTGCLLQGNLAIPLGGRFSAAPYSSLGWMRAYGLPGGAPAPTRVDPRDAPSPAAYPGGPTSHWNPVMGPGRKASFSAGLLMGVDF